MKQTNFLKNKLVLGLMLIMVTIGLTSMKEATAYDPTGIWNYEVETPDGNMNDILTISKEEEAYNVSVSTSQYGTLELGNITLKENTMTADVDMQGAIIDFEFVFDGDTMEGEVTTPDADLIMTAKRKKE